MNETQNIKEYMSSDNNNSNLNNKSISDSSSIEYNSEKSKKKIYLINCNLL
jgi:hypothetical protein